MEKEFLGEELNRMKSLFVYEKGRVISEQISVKAQDEFSKYPCLSTLQTTKVATGTNIQGPTQEGVNMKNLDYKGNKYSFRSDGTLFSNGVAYGTFKCGATQGTIIITIKGKEYTINLNQQPK